MRSVLIFCCALLLAACGPAAVSPPTIAPTLAALPDTLTIGQPVQGQLGPASRQAEWMFEAQAGQVLNAQVTEGEGLLLSLYDASGERLAQGARLSFTVTLEGMYVIRVQLTGDDPTRYTLLVSPQAEATEPEATLTATPEVRVELPTPTLPPFEALGTLQAALVPGQTTFGAFNTAGEQHVYTFEAAAGTFARARMERTSGTVDPVLTLYAPDGTRLILDDNSGGGRSAFIQGVRLPVDGEYALVAAGDNLTGTYEITFLTGGEPFPVTPQPDTGLAMEPTATPVNIVLTPTVPQGVSGNRLDDHQPVRGSIDRPGGISRYIIQADAGEVFTVGLQPNTAGFTPQLEMSSPSGSIAASETTPGADGEIVIHSFEAPSTGGYVVFVSGQDDTTGDFTLAYGRGDTRDTIRKGETFPDRTYDASTRRRAVRDDWFLRLNAGDMITASAVSTDDRFDPALTLLGPDGSRIIFDDNGGGGLDAQIHSVRAPVTGVYTLRVTGADPRVFGLYSLIWRYIEAAPTPTPPLLVAGLFSVDDTVTPDAPQDYPVQASAGERLLIQVEAAPGSGLDTLVELVNAEGEVVATDDDSGGNLNPELLAQVPADGLYSVRVRVYDDGSNTGGPFVLRVQRAY